MDPSRMNRAASCPPQREPDLGEARRHRGRRDRAAVAAAVAVAGRRRSEQDLGAHKVVEERTLPSRAPPATIRRY